MMEMNETVKRFNHSSMNSVMNSNSKDIWNV